MKKIFILLLLFLSCFSLISCGNYESNNTPNDNPSNQLPEENQPNDNNTNNENQPDNDNKNDDNQNGEIEDTFEDYGMEVIIIDLSEVLVSSSGIYNTMEEVGAYIYTYHQLPSNYRTKSNFNKSEYTALNKLSCGGDRFQNREGLLPKAQNRTFTECDIDYKGGSRNAKRIVFSSDWLIFYTEDHYASFYILRFINSSKA